MCIAFDGAYLLEAPAAAPDPADDHRRPSPEVTAPDEDREPEYSSPA